MKIGDKVSYTKPCSDTRVNGVVVYIDSLGNAWVRYETSLALVCLGGSTAYVN